MEPPGGQLEAKGHTSWHLRWPSCLSLDNLVTPSVSFRLSPLANVAEGDREGDDGMWTGKHNCP